MVTAEEFWNRKEALSTKNKQYKTTAERFVQDKLKEDGKDITGNLFPTKHLSKAYIIAKESGILAGCEEVHAARGPLKVKWFIKDGQHIKKGDLVGILTGKTRTLLKYERTVLNLIQRLSGIATATHNIQKKIGKKCRVAGTRKTLWGVLDKKGIVIGGGYSHRLNLSDGVLIKNNHIKKLGVTESLRLASKVKETPFIEIELENAKQVQEFLEAYPSLPKSKQYAVMLDNWKPTAMKAIVAKLKRKKILVEVSGGITEKNAAQYAKTGADIMSLGALTHSAQSLDISMRIL